MSGVVFVVLDTLRRDKLSVYNEEIGFTQNIESFSEEATVFEDGVAQAPWTLPSHASMFTGLYPWEHGATEKKLFLKTDQKLLAEKFSDAGYETACFSANPWIAGHTGLIDGFDKIDNNFPFISGLPDFVKSFWKNLDEEKKVWVYGFLEKFGEPVMSFVEENNSSETESIIDSAKSFVESSEEDYFMFLNLMDAHLPYMPPENYREKHAPEVNPSNVCQVGYKHNAGIVDADFEALEKLYDAEVDYMDDMLGELLDVLDDDTTIVIVSDHGEHLGEEDMIDHQFSLSEKLINVPLIIKSPKLEEERIDSQFELKDLYNLIPALEGLEDRPEMGTEYAYGGLEYPDMHLKNIPEDRRKDFAWRLRFVRNAQKKLVRSEDENITEDKMIDLKTGETTEIDQSFVKKIDRIGNADEGRTEVDEEKVKEQLEELGYM